MRRELNFDPFPLFPGAHQQTIIGTFNFFRKKPHSTTRLIDVVGGDRIALEITKPSILDPKAPLILLVHGLCGSHESPYMVRMAKKLSDEGYITVRMNLRGCGSGKGHSKKMYHSGCSHDVLEAACFLHREFGGKKVTLIGFSLGGNIVLKLAGELNSSATDILKEVIAVAPPIDIFHNVSLIQNNINRFYENYFMGLLKADVLYRHSRFPELGHPKLPKKLTFYEFDNCYTAPHCGFDGAMDYYKKSSAINVIHQVELPCRILFSEDDPIVSATVLDHLSLPDHIQIFKTKRGGHLGYLGIPGSARGFHWMDSILMEWIQETDR